MRSRARIVLSVPFLIIVAVLTGALLFIKSDFAAEHLCGVLESSTRERLGLNATLGTCQIDLLPPSIAAGPLKLVGKSGSRLLVAEQIRVDLDFLDLLSGHLRIEQVDLRAPHLTLALQDGKIVNLPDLHKGSMAAEGKSGGGVQELFRNSSILPEAITIQGARIDLALDRQGLIQLRDGQFDLRRDDDGKLALTLSLGGGTLDLAGAERSSIQLGVIKAQIQGTERRLELVRFAAELGGMSLDLGGELSLSGKSFEPKFRVSASGPLSIINQFVPGPPDMRGQVVLRAEGKWLNSGPSAKGAAEVKGFGIVSVHDVDLTAGLRVEGKRIKLEDLAIFSPAGRVAGSLHLDWHSPYDFAGELELAEADLQEALLLAGQDFHPISLHGSGKTRFRGRFVGKHGPYVILDHRMNLDKLTVQVSRQVLDWSGATLRAEAAFTGNRVRFPGFVIERGGSKISGKGKIRFRDGHAWAQIQVDPLDLADFTPVVGLAVAGQGRMDLDVDGLLPLATIEAKPQIAQVFIENRSLGDLNGLVRVSTAGLVFESMRLARAGGIIHCDGHLGLDSPHKLDASLKLERLPAPALVSLVRPGPPPSFIGGLLGGQVQARGSLENPDLEFRVGFADLRLGDQAFEEGGALGRYRDGAWELDLFEARMGPGWIFARGSISSSLELDLLAYSTGLRHSSFHALGGLKDTLDFRIDLHTTVKGPLLSPALEGWAKVYDTHLAGRRVAGSFVSTRATTESVQVQGRFMGKTATLDGRMELTERLPFSASLHFDARDLGRFIPQLSEEEANQAVLKGSIQASGRLLAPESIEASLGVEQASMRIAGLEFVNRGPWEISMASGRMDVGRFELTGPKTELRISGFADQKRLRIDAAGRVDFSLFPLLLSWMPRASGQVNLWLGLGGSWSSPRIEGRAEILADQVRIRGFGLDLEAVQGELRFTPERLDIVRLIARLGGGQVAVRGGLDLERLIPGRLALTLELDRVRYEVNRQMWALGSGTLGLLREPGKRIKLSGELEIFEGAFKESISLVSLSNGLFRRRRAYVQSYDRELEMMDLDVRLRASDKFMVLYDLELVKFESEMKGALRLTGTNQRLGLLGEVESLGGHVSYLSKRFDVQSARVHFEERYEIQPKFEVIASRIEAVDRGEEGETSYDVNLQLVSDGSDLRVGLRSTPSLDERDIITLLSLGVTSRDVDSLKSEDVFGLGGESFVRSFKLDERLSQIFPFPADVIKPKYFRLRSRFSTKTGTAPRLETGVKLRVISENLDLDYSRSLFDDTDQSLDLSYRLTRGVSARMHWENSEETDLGDLGLDLKLNWEW